MMKTGTIPGRAIDHSSSVEGSSHHNHQMSIVPINNQLIATTAGKKSSTSVDRDIVEICQHDAEVLGIEFSSTGRSCLTASGDKTIKIFSVYSEEHECLAALKGHKNAILEAHWSSDCDRIYSCSADETCALWDPTQQTRIMRLHGHEGIVNCCAVDGPAPNLLVSGSDDGTTKVWDLRVRRSVISFPHRYQILSVAFDGLSHRVFSGSLDSYIRCYDIRKVSLSPPPNPHTTVPPDSSMEDVTSPDSLFVLKGHINTITGIALSSDKSHLVSCSADQTVRIWDARPFCKDGDDKRELALCKGPTHNFEQILHRVRWSPDNLTISCGSADRSSYIISVEGVASCTQIPQLLYKLPGHLGAVTEVAFHPTEKIIASASTDKKVLLRRLK